MQTFCIFILTENPFDPLKNSSIFTTHKKLKILQPQFIVYQQLSAMKADRTESVPEDFSP